MKTNNFLRTTLLVVAALTTLCLHAAINGGTITLTVGQTYTVNADFGGGLTQTGSWSKSNSTFTFVSQGNKSCTISGNQVGTGTLYYDGVAGSYDVNYYWTINVISNTNNNENNNDDGDTNEADDPNADWATVGNYSLAWYDSEQSEFIISNNRELAGVAYLVNNKYTDFAGKTIKLSDDIDLSGKKWIPIGTNNYFQGTFNGQGHTISGINVGSYKNYPSIFGFLGNIKNAIISNVILRGKIDVVNPMGDNSNYNERNYYIGGLAASADRDCLIENCKCDMPVKFSRSRQSGGRIRQIYIGGLLGYAYSSNILCCSHIGDVTCIQNYSSTTDYSNVAIACDVGGLVGQGGTIEYSENISSTIYCEVPVNARSANSISVGGIVGSGGSVKHCRSISSFNIIHDGFTSTPLSTLTVYVGGITGNGYGVTDSYTSISEVALQIPTANTVSVYYGGINGNYSGECCFSNSDIYIKSNKSYTSRYQGSTSFTSSQMQSSAFLEELNIYSKGTWGQKEGEYPYIIKLQDAMTGIYLPSAKEYETSMPSKSGVYNLSGQKIHNMNGKKGIYIINSKKVLMK